MTPQRALRGDAAMTTPADSTTPTSSSSAPASPARSSPTRLAQAGVKVTIVEAGPRVERGAAVTQFYDALVKVPECAYPNTAYAPHPRSDDLDALLRAGRPAEIREHLPAPGRRHDVALARHLPAPRARRLPPRDALRPRRRLADRLRRARAVVRARPKARSASPGDSADDLGSPRSQPYPMPAIAMSYLDQHDRAGVRGHALPGARRRRRAATRSCATTAPPCCGNNSCIPICPIQAKYDATVHVARAEAAGARRARAVGRLRRSTSAATARSTAVRYKRPDGSAARAHGARCSCSPRTRWRFRSCC